MKSDRVWRKGGGRNKKVYALGKRRKDRILLTVGLASLVALSLLGVVFTALRLEEFRIEKIVIVGNETMADTLIRDRVSHLLSGTYFYFIPKDNFLAYPKSNIAAVLLGAYPRIKNIFAETPDPSTLLVTVEEREPFALWCGETYHDTGNNRGNCYFIDEGGYIFAKAPDFSDNVYFTYFGELDTKGSMDGIPIGGRFMNEIDFTGLQSLIRGFEEFDFPPTALTKGKNNDIELRLRFGTVVIFGREQDLSILLDTLESVFDSEEFKNAAHRELLYIDLRFGNKVFYKYADDGIIPE